MIWLCCGDHVPGKGLTAVPITKLWTEADTAKLKSLDGQSALRASAALGRSLATVKKKARLHGVTLVGARESRVKVREVGAVVRW
jgi:hypothetical protein